ncbi:MAG: hypothetical protein LBL26_03055 [Peptococcaceae bacterium]|nr:hypothetical protein [Peptococcaceae bacterium]
MYYEQEFFDLYNWARPLPVIPGLTQNPGSFFWIPGQARNDGMSVFPSP